MWPWLCWTASDNAVLCHPSRETSPITSNFYIVIKEKQKAWPILMLAHSDTLDSPGQPCQKGLRVAPELKVPERKKASASTPHNRLSILSLPHVAPTSRNYCFLHSDAVILFPLVDMTLYDFHFSFSVASTYLAV